MCELTGRRLVVDEKFDGLKRSQFAVDQMELSVNVELCCSLTFFSIVKRNRMYESRVVSCPSDQENEGSTQSNFRTVLVLRRMA